MSGRREFRVVAPTTLDRALLAGVAGLSRRAARQLIDGGQVFVDGARALVRSRQLPAGARVLVYLEPPTPAPAPPVRLYEDERIVVLDKPAGLHIHPSETLPEAALVEALGPGPWFPVHRLDRSTTGVLLLAKERAAAEALTAAFRARSVHKTYLAAVDGVLAPTRIDAAIAADPRRPRARRVCAHGKPAVTMIGAVSSCDGLSIVRAEPETGRTHQIRVHLAHVGAPILGDTLYGGPTGVRLGGAVVRVARPMLHALRLELTFDGTPLCFTAPLPADLAELLRLGFDTGRLGLTAEVGAAGTMSA